MDNARTLFELVRNHVASGGHYPAVTFLGDLGEELDAVDYDELDARARTVAGALQERVEAGDRALLVFAPSLEYVVAFMGCVYAGVIAVPTYPPNTNRSAPPLSAFAADCEAALILTQDVILANRAAIVADDEALGRIPWLSIDDIERDAETTWSEPGLTADSPVFIQYTSGSTTSPRGVLLSHGNLMENLGILRGWLDIYREDTGVHWIPPYHDMGLIGGILEPFYTGCHAVLMSPLAFLQRPFVWLDAVSRYKAVVSAAPNFAYDLAVRKVREEQRAKLDLSSWQVAINGAEPVQRETLDRFVAAFGPHGFRAETFSPAYGLAEATLVVSASRKQVAFGSRRVDARAFERNVIMDPPSDAADALDLVSCGAPIGGQRVEIVDPETRRALPAGDIGEIWLAGPCVAQGYWGRPDESEEVFRARLDDPSDETTFLRTGDLGFVEDGELFVTGRAKDLIIIAGRNLHPQDLEVVAEKSHPVLRAGCGVAYPVVVAGEERVGIVHEVEKRQKFDVAEVTRAIRDAIAASHQIRPAEVVLVERGELPKTSSGKKKRSAAKQDLDAGRLREAGRWTEATGIAGDEEVAPAVEETGAKVHTSAEIADWLTVKLAELLGIDPSEIDARRPLLDFGVGSVEAAAIAEELGGWLGRDLPAPAVFDHPTIEALAGFLGDSAPAPAVVSSVAGSVQNEPIAVVGLACRLPGAPDEKAFRELLRSGRDAVREIPPDRWDIGEFYTSEQGVPGKMHTRWIASIDGIDQFDEHFFGVSPREAGSMDPQQRLLLETTWHALEDASISPDAIRGTRCGVFVGIAGVDYSQRVSRRGSHWQLIDAYSGTGNAHSVAANRLSFLLDLRGPSFAVDTACSSSLVAAHLACQSLKSGESDVAVVGGVNAIVSPELSIAFSHARMLSADGRCKTFDESADGYVRGEGCGVVLLKRLSDAVRDGDTIRAVISGSAVNQDGQSNGLTAPSSTAQHLVMQRALSEAGLEPSALTYFEAHGTGTPLGDPVEVQSIVQLLGDRPADAERCLLGSVKANIGHLEAASGMASLVKVILGLEHGEVYPQVHFNELNPRIRLDGSPLEIATELQEWKAAGDRRVAGVNSFGFGGTNAHLVVEQAPEREPVTSDRKERPLHLLTVSARTEDALRELTGRYGEQLATTPDRALGDVISTAQRGRGHFEERAALVGATARDLRDELERLAAGEPRTALRGRKGAGDRPTVGFLFTGQGSQYPGMGRDLYEREPAFREAIDECARLFEPYLDVPLTSLLDPEPSRAALLDRTEYTQPAVFAIDYALSHLWRSWGVEPAMVCGHSLGEYVAAVVAGVFTLDDAARLVAERARLMGTLPAGGGMAVVFADQPTVETAIDGHHAVVGIAALNGPSTLTISGPDAELSEVLARLQSRGVTLQRLTVSHAMHSVLMEPMLDEFEHVAQGVPMSAPKIPLLSNVTGRPFAPGVAPDAAYWRRHLREPVKFADCVEAMAETGCQVFLENGPNPVLVGLAKRCVSRDGHVFLSSLKRGQPDHEVVLGALGELYVTGVEIDWEAFHAPFGRRRVAVPTYPFQRSRHWWPGEGAAEPAVSPEAALPVDGSSDDVHPLAGRLLSLAHPAMQSHVGVDQLEYLRDHQLQGSTVFPAAGYVEMALAATAASDSGVPAQLSALEFKRALFLPEDRVSRMQVVLSPDEHGNADVRIYSEGDSPEEPWTLHVTGRVGPSPSANGHGAHRFDIDEFQAAATEEAAGRDLYEALRIAGLEYGPTFQAVRRVWRRDGEALAELAPAAELGLEAGGYHLHPALLDGALHAVASAAGSLQELLAQEAGLGLPTAVDEVRVLRSPGADEQLLSHARLRGELAEQVQALDADITIYDVHGRPVAEIVGLHVQRLELAAQGGGDGVDSWLYEQRWIPQERAETDGADLTVDPIIVVGEPGALRDAVSEQLSAATVAPDALTTALGAAAGGRTRVVFIPADAPADEGTAAEVARGCEQLLGVVQELAAHGGSPAPQLSVVTVNGQGEGPVSLTHAPVAAMARTIAHEHPELDCLALDVDGASTDAAAWLADEIAHATDERLVALRGGVRNVARLVRREEDSTGEADAAVLVPPAGGAYRLETAAVGMLDKLTLSRAPRRAPETGQVEIEVSAAALNFRDVMKAMGVYPSLPGDLFWLGDECAGRVSAVGEGVEGLAVGDEVLAVAPACFGSHAMTAADYVVPKPANLGFDEAAATPIVFCTAWYALHHLARLQPGERVLIHAAAGGVGLAAIQMAQAIGAEIFATAGSDEKRDFVRGLGVEHVMDSRSTAFADQILELTGGEGVDVVLNSLAGDAIPKSLSVLKPFGRFLEIGKRDIFQNAKLGLRPFQRCISFFAIDLDRVFRERRSEAADLLREVTSRLEDGTWKPLPTRTWPVTEAPAAFRHLAQARNIGKVVLEVDSDRAVADARVRPDRSYLVTGGLGALGLAVARGLADRGARRLVLAGRSAPKAEAEQAIAELRASGVDVAVHALDVADADAVDALVAEIDDSGAPLGGVVHAAGLLRDAFLVNTDATALREVLAPKVSGALNLHTATQGRQLDFFALFSSGVSLLGSPGQANYVAANAFLDALAQHRRLSGQTALAINWGAWAEIGLAARAGADGPTVVDQVGTIPPAAGVDAFLRLLEEDVTQVAVLPIDWGKWAELFPAAARVPLLAELVDASGATAADGDAGLLDALASASETEREAILQDYLAGEIAQVLQTDASLIDPSQQLNRVGLDSLMALELKNRVEAALRLTLPMVALVEGPSLRQLSAQLAELVAEQTPWNGQADDGRDADWAADVLDRIEDLSDDEVDALLVEMAPSSGGSDG